MSKIEKNKIKTEIHLKEAGKSNKGTQFYNVYFMNAPVYFASVHKPKKKYQSDETEWSIDVFVDKATRDEALDKVLINKEIREVGVDKNKKRQVTYKLSTQVDEGVKTNYDLVNGLHGFKLTRSTLKKDGSKNTPVSVIGTETDDSGTLLEFKEDIGNGSVCNIKCFAYKNQDGLMNLMLDTVQVVEHIPYEGGGDVQDDMFGGKVARKEVTQSSGSKETVEEESFSDDGFDDDDDIPF